MSFCVFVFVFGGEEIWGVCFGKRWVWRKRVGVQKKFVYVRGGRLGEGGFCRLEEGGLREGTLEAADH